MTERELQTAIDTAMKQAHDAMEGAIEQMRLATARIAEWEREVERLQREVDRVRRLASAPSWWGRA